MTSGVLFVGREAELEELSSLARTGGAALVVGDSGVGKTRLLAELAARCRHERRLVLSVGCLPLSTRLPLMPIVDVLRSAFPPSPGSAVDDALRDCPDFIREDLRRLVEQVGFVEGDLTGAWRQQRLFTAVARFLECVRDLTGLVVIIDDLQWSDATSKDLITYLLAHQHQRPLAMIMAATSASAIDDDPVSMGWLQRLSSATPVNRISLAPLTPTEVAELTGTSGEARRDTEWVAQLHARTGGNPFLLEQLMAAEAAGRLGELPASVVEFVAFRTNGLEAPTRAVLILMAAARRPMSESELIGASGQTADLVRTALHQLITRRLVERRGSDAFALRHGLVGEAVLDGMLPGELQDLHATLAIALSDPERPATAAEVGDHWAEARRPEHELPARVCAAGYAESIAGFGDAAAQWERALDLAESVEPTAAADIAMHAMAAWALAGDEARGAPLGLRGLRANGGVADPVVEAGLRARTAMLMFPRDRARAISDLEDAVAMLAALPPSAMEVEALARLYSMYRAHGSSQAGRAHLDRAIVVGANLLPRAVESYVAALTNLAYEQVIAGDTFGATQSMSTARQTTQRYPDPAELTAFAVAETYGQLLLNDLESAVETGRHHLDALRAQGFISTFGVAMLTANVLDAMIALGRTDDAAALVTPLTDGTPSRSDNRALHLLRGKVDLARGDVAGAESRIASVLSVSRSPGLELQCEMAQLTAEIDLWRGEPEKALALVLDQLDRLTGTADEHLAAQLLVMGMRASADMALDTRGRRNPQVADRAAEAREGLQIRRQSLRTDVFADHPLFALAPVEGLTFRAECARGLGEETSAAAWQACAVSWELQRHPHRAAYALWRLSASLLAEGRRSEATETLRAAWQHAEQHVPLRSEIERLARAARITVRLPEDPQRAQPIAVATPAGLTDRELEVLLLVMEGFTNSQIGMRLYMSPKTASVHVTAILRKLGATNRVEAASIAHRMGIHVDQDPRPKT